MGGEVMGNQVRMPGSKAERLGNQQCCPKQWLCPQAALAVRMLVCTAYVGAALKDPRACRFSGDAPAVPPNAAESP